MNKKTLIIIAATAIVIIGAAMLFTYIGNYNEQSSRANSKSSSKEVQADTSSTLYKQYAKMTGETYDRTFIANMIAHHQGAVVMANLALANAKHQELKDMANSIVTAQEKEIADMTAWQKEWGYLSTSTEHKTDHSAMGMMDEMQGMSLSLDGKTGDDFDKAFLEHMILHHQSAIDMAAPGKDNSSRQEVKDITVAIVNAQSEEIRQMRQWQKDWGYKN